jgi:hypothetical protein
MKRILFLLILSLTYIKTVAQVKLNIWTQTDKIAQTLTTDKLGQLPQTFESKMPDGSTVVYEKWERPTVNFTTSSGKKSQYKPQVWKAKQGVGLVSLTSKGWMGLQQTSSGKSFSMTYSKVNIEAVTRETKSTISSINKTSSLHNDLIIDTTSHKNKEIAKLTVSSAPPEEFTRNDFYDPTRTIPVVCSLYVEVDWNIYKHFYPVDIGETQLVEDWINLLYQNVSLVYDREGVILELHDMHIWDTQDPYGYWNSTSLLTTIPNFQFRKQNNQPRATSCFFKQLLLEAPPSYGDGGAVANFVGINGFTFTGTHTPGYMTQCSGFNVRPDFDGYTLPTPLGSTSSYNWCVFLASHEIGHNMGSDHTHRKFWRDEDNESIGRIDSCASELSEIIKSPRDYTIPSIMSYCWGDEPVAPFARDFILQNGFGKLPRFAIRSNVFFSKYPPSKPQVQTKSISNITSTTVVVNCDLINIGTWHYAQRGARIRKNPSGDWINYVDDVTTSQTFPTETLGGYSINIANLEPNTSYTVQAYCKSFTGDSYGQGLTLTTTTGLNCPPGVGLPNITTNIDVSNDDNVQISGTATPTDNQSILPAPDGIGVTTSLYPFELNLLQQTKFFQSYYETGQFGPNPVNYTFNLNSEVDQNNSYYLKSFASSYCGTKSSDITTISRNSVFLPNVTTLPISIISSGQAKLQGTVNSNYPILKRGFEIRLITLQEIVQPEDLPLLGNFELDYVYGPITNNLPGRMFRAWAENQYGRKYGVWRRIIPQSLSGIPSLVTNGLNVSFSGAYLPPNFIQPYKALSQNVLSCPSGTCDVINKGVVWSQNTYPDITSPNKIQLDQSLGTYSCVLTGLEPQTLYYLRPFVTYNYQGSTITTYGQNIKFQTKSVGNCNIENFTVYKKPNWTYKFNLNPSCSTYTVSVSRYKSFNPTVPPTQNSVPIITNDRLTNYTISTSEFFQGFIEKEILPKPQLPTGVDGCWFSVNVYCNGGCTGTKPTKYFFFVNRLEPID